MVGNIAKVSHQVFFWLNDPESQADLEKLFVGIRSLAAIETVRGMHVGVPAATESRDVIDSSYSASALLFFDSVADEQIYQTHPLHQQFIADCGHVWRKVVVFDSVSNHSEMDFGL